MNKTPTPLSANDLSNNAQPTALYITQGSFGIMSTVELRGDTLYYSAASYSEEEVIGSLDPERWQTFRQTLESLQAAQWQPYYINGNVLDGHQWKVKIAYADGPLIEVSGGNAYPSVLDLDYTIGDVQSLDWLLFTCAVTWLTNGRWNRDAVRV